MSPRRSSPPSSSFGNPDIDCGPVKPTRDSLLTSIATEEEIENEIESQLTYPYAQRLGTTSAATDGTSLEINLSNYSHPQGFSSVHSQVSHVQFVLLLVSISSVTVAQTSSTNEYTSLLKKQGADWVPTHYSDKQLNEPGMVCVRFNNFWCIKSPMGKPTYWNG